MDQVELTDKLIRIKMLADECLRDIAANQRQRPPVAAHTPKKPRVSSDLNFTLPIRPFIKKYASGLSGPKKFTLLVAFHSKGDNDMQVSFVDIKKNWSKMTARGLLGMKFNSFYSGEARNNDWVSAEKKGFYNLRPSWKEILE